MPAKSSKQYGLMQAAAHGKLRHPAGPSAAVAKEFVKKTPKAKRKKFAKILRGKRSDS